MRRISPVLSDASQLTDESRWHYAVPQAIVFPASEDDLRSVLDEARQKKWAVYVQGAKTGLSSASIPAVENSLLISLAEYPSSIVWNELRTITVSAAATLRQVEDFLLPKGFLLPPNPTESSAMVGGALACNASGSRSFAFGSIRAWVKSLRVMLVDGNVICLSRVGRFGERGHRETEESSPRFSSTLQLPDTPSLDFPTPRCKNSAGYYPGGEPIDLFVGSEGTLGIILDAELALLPQPQIRLPMICFFDQEDKAHEFILKTRQRSRDPQDLLYTVILEFIGQAILEKFPKLPGMPTSARAAVMLEHWSGGSSDVSEESLLSAWSAHMLGCGAISDPADPSFPQILLATDETRRRDLEAFRHQIPQTMNAIVARAGFPKLATDCAVPDERYMDIINLYRGLLDPCGLEWYYFGHAGDNHLHVNLITHSQSEFERAKRLYGELCQGAVALGGTVSAEHGIGKNKIPYFQMMYAPESNAIAQMKAVKRALDPQWRLNPGALFPLA